jgi:hypothetical protein
MKKPTSWDDISVDQFMELKSLDFETERDELHMISIILDLPIKLCGNDIKISSRQIE